MGVVIDDYPYRPHPRRVHSRIAKLIAEGMERYRKLLQTFLSFTIALQSIPVEPDPTKPHLPHWNNHWIPALDAISLYCLIASLKPRFYVEIGSGLSTRFARVAIRNSRLDTKVISIDPLPRADVETLCDVSIRSALEEADLSIFDVLSRDDVVFIDSSHRSFQNSDVTVFFTEVLPRLSSGIVYGIHDIFLPFDYGEPTLPKEWTGAELPESREAIAARFEAFIPRFYNEQYLLASYLLGGAAGDEIVLPCAWVSSRHELSEILAPIWRTPGFGALSPWGGTFWARRGPG